MQSTRLVAQGVIKWWLTQCSRTLVSARLDIWSRHPMSVTNQNARICNLRGVVYTMEIVYERIGAPGKTDSPRWLTKSTNQQIVQPHTKKGKFYPPTGIELKSSTSVWYPTLQRISGMIHGFVKRERDRTFKQQKPQVELGIEIIPMITLIMSVYYHLLILTSL